MPLFDYVQILRKIGFFQDVNSDSFHSEDYTSNTSCGTTCATATADHDDDNDDSATHSPTEEEVVPPKIDYWQERRRRKTNSQ